MDILTCRLFNNLRSSRLSVAESLKEVSKLDVPKHGHQTRVKINKPEKLSASKREPRATIPKCYASAMQVLCKCYASAMQVLCKCYASAMQVLLASKRLAML